MTALRLCLLVPLAGCLAPWGSSMRSKGDSPIRLGSVESALFVQSGGSDASDGRGSGEVLLLSGPMSCSALLDDDLDTDLLFEESGIFGAFSWWHSPFDGDDDPADVGWEGQYWSGMEVETVVDDGTVRRAWSGMVFGDGAVISGGYYNYSGGGGGARASITSFSADRVVGHLESSLYEANFSAENCGARSTGDTGDFRDTGDFDAN